MRAASSVDRTRRALLAAPFALTASALLGGCAQPVRRPAEVTAALASTLAAGDRPGFLRWFADAPGAQLLGARVFDALASLSGRITPGPAPELRVGWQLPDEPAVVSEATLALAGGRVSNLTASSTGTEWLSGPPVLSASSGLTVAATTQAALAGWIAPARAGLAALRAVTPAGRLWTSPLVLLVPADLAAFARYAGAGADRTAAVTVVPGTPDSAGVRVVVNPAAGQNLAERSVLLTHEAVHAGMGSPRLTGTPAWLLEGIAEALTARAHPSVATGNRRLAGQRLAAGLPAELPDVADGDPTGYALAQLAVEAMVDRVGWTAVLAEARARTRGGAAIRDGEVLAWYRAAAARS